MFLLAITSKGILHLYTAYQDELKNVSPVTKAKPCGKLHQGTNKKVDFLIFFLISSVKHNLV